MDFSIIIPCYKSKNTISKLLLLIDSAMNKYKYEVILVNDSSPDNGETWNVIKSESEARNNVIGIDLAKNYGQHNAILCGMSFASGEYIICMDDDMQTHPKELYKLIDKVSEGYDVVYATYAEKKHAFYRNLGSKFSYLSTRLLLDRPKDIKTSSFWICKKFIRDSIIKYGGRKVFLPGLVLRATKNIGNVEVQHYEREEGTSGYTLKKLIKLWICVAEYSIKPLRMAFYLGLIISIGAVIGALFFTFRKIFTNVGANGWTSLMVATCFLSGVIIMLLGIIGEYIGRICLSVSSEPQYTIRTVEGVKE